MQPTSTVLMAKNAWRAKELRAKAAKTSAKEGCYYFIFYLDLDMRRVCGVIRVMEQETYGVLLDLNTYELMAQYEPIPLARCPLAVRIDSPLRLCYAEAERIVSHPFCNSMGYVAAIQYLYQCGLLVSVTYQSICLKFRRSVQYQVEVAPNMHIQVPLGQHTTWKGIIGYEYAKKIVEHPCSYVVGTKGTIKSLVGYIYVGTYTQLWLEFKQPELSKVMFRKLSFEKIAAWYCDAVQEKKVEQDENAQYDVSLIVPAIEAMRRFNVFSGEWDNVRPVCMSCMDHGELHFCSSFKHCLCTECFIQTLETKVPNSNATKCICTGTFTLRVFLKPRLRSGWVTFPKPRLRFGWLAAYEHSMIASIIPLAYCSWCLQCSERDVSHPVHVCLFCSKHTCGACFGKYFEDHKCPILINPEEQEIVLKCANVKCGLTGIVEAKYCMKIHCCACGQFTCACCFQDITNVGYNHFCRSFPTEKKCMQDDCKHCYCWPNREIANTVHPAFLKEHPHLNF